MKKMHTFSAAVQHDLEYNTDFVTFSNLLTRAE